MGRPLVVALSGPYVPACVTVPNGFLPLVGHQHPLLPALIRELPYVPETIQCVHDSDHRLPYRPLM